MIRLVQADTVIDRRWMVFFGEADGAPWWSRFLRPGYRHVSACSWYAAAERWVYLNPARTGTVIMIFRDEEFGPKLTQLLNGSSLVLAVHSRAQRSSTPFGWWCTGAIKALLGVRSGALSPLSLSRHLLRHGAEVLARRDTDGLTFRRTERSDDGRPRGEGVAGSGAPAR